MISVVIQDEDGLLGEMRIEQIGPQEYSIQYAADSGAGWVDAKQRVLYGFEAEKYNVLALVSEALNVLDLADMVMTDASRSGHLARRQLGAGETLLDEANDPVRHHRPALRSGQPEQQLGDSGWQEVCPEDHER
jgi:hypothetical protein